MSHSNLNPGAPDFAKYVEKFEGVPGAQPRLKARIAAWAYNVLVVSLMTATMIAWAFFLGSFINKFS